MFWCNIWVRCGVLKFVKNRNNKLPISPKLLKRSKIGLLESQTSMLKWGYFLKKWDFWSSFFHSRAGGAEGVEKSHFKTEPEVVVVVVVVHVVEVVEVVVVVAVFVFILLLFRCCCGCWSGWLLLNTLYLCGQIGRNFIIFWIFIGYSSKIA